MRNKGQRWCAFVPVLVAFLGGCGEGPSVVQDSARTRCEDSPQIAASLPEAGRTVFLFRDGGLYIDSTSGCARVGTYFTPGFDTANYTRILSTDYLKTSQGLLPVRDRFLDPFQRYSGLADLFLRSVHDTDRFWNSLTLQGPASPTVPEYVALRKCLLDGTCAFRDNRVDLVADPLDASNRVARFTAVAPIGGMVTSKASIESSMAHFADGDDLWYRARYLFSDSLPYSIADFESQWFWEFPGPRIVFDQGALAIEGKFGAKQKFLQPNPVPVPRRQWVSVAVHFHFDPIAGSIELWQDGVQVLSTVGPTLPLSFAIQTNLEVGITATDRASVVYMDDVQLSKQPILP